MQKCKNAKIIHLYSHIHPHNTFLAFLHSCTSDNTHNVSLFNGDFPVALLSFGRSAATTHLCATNSVDLLYLTP